MCLQNPIRDFSKHPPTTTTFDVQYEKSQKLYMGEKKKTKQNNSINIRMEKETETFRK